MHKESGMKVLSIDAWGSKEEGYQWNNWFLVGEIAKEDFEKFAEGLKETIDYIKANQEVVEKRYEYSENYNEQSKADDDFSFEI